MDAPRILLVRPDHLGDVLLTLPAAAGLRRALPGARLGYLAAPSTAAILERSPDLNEVLTLPFPGPAGGPPAPRWAEAVAAVAPRLRRFDVAVLLRPGDAWGTAVVTGTGIPIRVGFAHPRTGAHLTHTILEPRAHAVELAGALAGVVVHALGPGDGQVVLHRPRIWPAPFEEDSVDGLLSGPLSMAGPSPILLHPGSGWPLKAWPPQRWVTLAVAIGRRCGTTPLVVGGPGEQGLVEDVAAASRGAAAPVAGLSLGELAALHARAAAVVSTDSGAMHLAALMGTRVVGLFGPGDPRLARPWADRLRARVVRVDLRCSPCGTMHDPPCGAAVLPACMTGISVGDALDALGEVLHRPAA
jgi:ADP-heptose:LPS heptosyltransferase